MIATLLLLAQIAVGAAAPAPAAPAPAAPAPAAPVAPAAPAGAGAFPELAPAAVLQRYAAALQKVRDPEVITFDYKLEQTGLRTALQTHRVFRSGNDERDETLTVDGKRLTPPKVRIFRGRRNRYTVGLLAPRPAEYTFAYIGSRKDGHHVDYLFRVTPTVIRPFVATDVAIDGVRFLPLSIGFSTVSNEGSGTILFGLNTRWWVPYVAQARAALTNATATERLTFYTYRFPLTLPDSTFSQAHRAAPPKRTLPLPRLAPGPGL